MADNVAILSTSINDDLDKKFRKAIGSRMGNKKGHIQTALEEAITNWLEGPKIDAEHVTRTVGNPKRPLVYLPDDYYGWEVDVIKRRKVN